MSEDALTLIADLTRVAARPRGLRSDFQAVLDILFQGTLPLYGFVLTVDAETENVEAVAAAGLDATTFRRLEERMGRTALMRAFEVPEQSRLLVNDEPTLDFLSNTGTAGELVCTPIESATRTIGLLAVAFDKKVNAPNTQVLRLFEIAASLLAGLANAGQVIEHEGRKLAEENLSLKQELKKRYDLRQLVGNSGAMRAVFDKVTQIARSNATVLVQGGSGSGKELIAQTIHHNSLRGKGPFIKVNCSALPDSAIDHEIFGDDNTPGLLDKADGGTLFVDEIGGLPQQTQVRLLRVLQEREFDRVGGTETVKANVRVIASTSRDLEELVAEGLLRADLFYRLSVFAIYLPPLRGRKSDILLLADHFLQKYSREHGKNILRISTPAIDMLTAYHFPGNVRELQNAIESAVLATQEAVIHAHHLPPTLQTAEESGTETRVTLESAVSAFERDMIADTLKSTRGNVAKAAAVLDSTERILGYKVRKYGIDPKRFK